MTTYINLGTGGADTWSDSVNADGDLPATGVTGEVRLVRSTGTVKYWNGSSWVATAGGASSIAELTAITDGSSASAGEINEILTASRLSPSTTGIAATATFGDVTSMVVTAGRWILTALIGFDDNGANLTGPLEGGISSSSTGAGLAAVDVVKDDSVSSGSTLNRSMVVPEQIISISSNTTYYLNSKFVYDSGTPAHFGRIRARRIG